MIFKYKEYRKFLKKMILLGQCQLFKNWQGEKVFLLRHDVDFDIELAHKLALIESEENIASTYFILATAQSYNIMSDKNRKLLIEMKEMGHEIGLHFDPSIYSDNLGFYCKKEADVLGFAVQEEIRSISLHNPSIHGQYPLFDGFVNAYDPALFSDDNYISDSRYSFRGKNPFEFIKNVNKTMIQINLHPMHYSENGLGYDVVFCEAFKRNINYIHSQFLVNSTYKEQVGLDFMAKFKNYIS